MRLEKHKDLVKLTMTLQYIICGCVGIGLWPGQNSALLRPVVASEASYVSERPPRSLRKYNTIQSS